jgi:hypothetical protein
VAADGTNFVRAAAHEVLWETNQPLPVDPAVECELFTNNFARQTSRKAEWEMSHRAPLTRRQDRYTHANYAAKKT